MKDIIRYLASLPRRQKQLVFVAMDVCVLPLIMWLVYAIRLAKPNVPVMQGLDFWYLYVGILGVLIFALLGIYSAIVRSFNEDYLLRISIATFIQIVGLYVIKKLDLAFIPMSIPLMYGFMLFSWMWWSRAVIRYATLKTFAKKQNRKRVAIYGAGLAGQQIAAALFFKILLVTPGKEFCSCNKYGTLFFPAIHNIGPLAYPPVPTAKSG